MECIRRWIAPGAVRHLLTSTTPSLIAGCNSLCSWLERTSQRESYAVHARLILPVSVLTVGATLAASLLDEAPHFSMGLMTLSLGCALVGFLFHRRNCQIWKDVGRRVQAEQRLLVDPARVKDWGLTARIPPDRLANAVSKDTPIKVFAADALAFYAAALLVAVLFALITLSQDDAGKASEDSVVMQPATEAPITEDLKRKPIF